MRVLQDGTRDGIEPSVHTLSEQVEGGPVAVLGALDEVDGGQVSSGALLRDVRLVWAQVSLVADASDPLS